MLKTFLPLFIFSTIIAVLIFSLQLAGFSWIYPLAWLIFAILFVLAFAGEAIVQRGLKGEEGNIILYVMGVTTVRLLISVVLALVFILTDKPNAKLFAGNFVVLYLLYLGFDIYSLLTNLRSHSKKR